MTRWTRLLPIGFVAGLITGVALSSWDSARADPERSMAQRQILNLVERATDALPDAYRTVFVARVIEGLSIDTPLPACPSLRGQQCRDYLPYTNTPAAP
mgnify:CR=1 FL=1